MSSRNIMRIELTNSAKRNLAKESDRTGITQVALMSKLVEWYVTQPAIVKDTLTVADRSYQANLAKMALKQLATSSAFA